MEARALRRVTVDSNPAAFPFMQGYVDVGQRLWWDVRFFFQEMAKRLEKRHKRDWQKWFQQSMTQAGLQDQLFLGGEHEVTDIMTSLAAVTFYAHTIDVGRSWSGSFEALRPRAGACPGSRPGGRA